MNWERLDWAALDRLRAGFLQPATAQGPYWKSASDLAAYNLTYAERIGWKWDAVIAELHLRGWKLPKPATGLRLLDWGCGSGVAGRRTIQAFGAEHFAEIALWDHSPLAVDFAIGESKAAFPNLAAVRWEDRGQLIDVLVISHVLNELGTEALAQLRALIARSRAVLWVEPGTHDVSRALQKFRDEARETFRIVAPCPHWGLCGLLVPGKERDWCHHFANPPAGVFADRDWVKFGQRAGIDLRSLPYSFVVLDRDTDAPPPPDDLARVIGRPEHFKPYARVLSCERVGVDPVTIPKRTAPQLYKHLERNRGPLLYRWHREGFEVPGGESAFDSSASR